MQNLDIKRYKMHMIKNIKYSKYNNHYDMTNKSLFNLILHKNL